MRLGFKVFLLGKNVYHDVHFRKYSTVKKLCSRKPFLKSYSYLLSFIIIIIICYWRWFRYIIIDNSNATLPQSHHCVPWCYNRPCPNTYQRRVSRKEFAQTSGFCSIVLVFHSKWFWKWYSKYETIKNCSNFYIWKINLAT